MGNSITFFSIENDQSLYRTESEKNTIGRTDQSDFVIPFSSISRNHGELLLLGNRWVLIDRASTNGTFLNNVRLDANKPYIIENGDQLVFGTFGTKIETTSSVKATPSLLLFNGDKYEGNFKIDEGTTFVYGGPKSTIHRSSEEDELAFVVKQENGELWIQKKGEQEKILLNSKLLTTHTNLADRDVIEIDGIMLLVSLSGKEGSRRIEPSDSEEAEHQPLPEYLKSRMGEDSWNDPYQEKLKNVESKLSLEVPELEDHRPEKATIVSARSELGAQRFSRPSLEAIKSKELAKERRYAFYGILTLAILMGMISILLSLYSKVIF